MIRKYYYLIIVLLSMPILSCNSFLDVVPDNVATLDIAFNSRTNAERFLYTLYGYLPDHASIQNPGLYAGDEIWINDYYARDWEGFIVAEGNQRVTNPYFGYYWSYLYTAIRDCNIFLENIEKVRDLDLYEKNRWISEAKFLKGYFHFWLCRMYGPIPIIRENISVGGGLDEVRRSRDLFDDVIDYIIELIDEALPGLPQNIQIRGQELGRITKPIAAAMKARILVTAASPLFNGNKEYANWVDDTGVPFITPEYRKQKWERAKLACEEAITLVENSGYKLYTFPGSNIFDLSDSTLVKMSIRGSVSEKWNPEVIWGNSNSTSANLQNWSFTRVDPNARPEILDWVASCWAPTFRMAELYYSNKGIPITEDLSYDYSNRFEKQLVDINHKYYMDQGFETIGLHLNREPRFYASLSFDGNLIYGQGRLDDNNQWVVKQKAGEVSGQFNNRDFSITGYLPKKLVNKEDALINDYSREIYPWPVIRLADLYLLYVESLNEVEGPSETAYFYIDKVRERAGLNGIVKSWQQNSIYPNKPLEQSGFREIIHQERLIELAFEGHRFWDMRRWLKMEEVMNSDIMGWSVDKKSFDEYYILRKVSETAFLKKDYLWPISESDIILNVNLVQAPGW